MIYVSPPKWPITLTAIARRPDPKKKKKNSSVSLHVVTHLCQFMAQNSEILGGGQKNLTTFWHLKNPKKSALFGPGNGQSVTYSKIRTKVCRVPWGPTYRLILDQISQCRVPSKLLQMCWKTDILHSMPCWTPSVCQTPPKMIPPYSLGTCPPTNPKTLWCPIAPSLRKNWFSEGIFFWQITQMALESPKIDICQNWPRRVLGDVIRCLESKFDKKIPMGSVPNCQKEIPARHAIRWFKCKLKPPKNRGAA